MKAVVFRSPDQPVRVEEVDLAEPGRGEVKVRIAAAGVCGSDLHLRLGDWEHPSPAVMGHEGAGVVVSVGAGVTHLQSGDHVVLAWVAPCGECRFCLAGNETRCSLAGGTVAPGGVLYDGTTRLSQNGQTIHHYLGVSAFAEEVVVPASGAIKVRDDAPLDIISIVGCAVATGVGAVRNTAAVPPGSTVVVIGCGGVGASIIQGARLAGASLIVAVDRVASKLELARRLGADQTVDAASDDVSSRLALLSPEGFDFVFDAVGAPATTEQAIAALGAGGAAVIVGLPRHGVTARFDPLKLAESEQRILGSNYGSISPSRDIPLLVDQYMAGELDLESLIGERLPLEDAESALIALSSGDVRRTLLIP